MGERGRRLSKELRNSLRNVNVNGILVDYTEPLHICHSLQVMDARRRQFAKLADVICCVEPSIGLCTGIAPSVTSPRSVDR